MNVGIIGLMLVGSVCASDEPTTLDVRLQAALVRIREARGVPGITLGVARAAQPPIALAAGVADMDTGVPLTPDARMLAGSVGKTFFAAVALQLVAENKLALDAPIAEYLGKESWFARLPNAAGCHVRHLMNHTSGLVRYEFDPRFVAELEKAPLRTWTPLERLAFVLDQPPPFAPGERFEYSDTNYIVLGVILEKILARDLYAEVQTRVLAPLHFTDSVPSISIDIPRLVQGHGGAGDPMGAPARMLANGKLVMNPQLEWTGGGYASTSRELAQWARELWSGRVIPAALLASVQDGVPAPMLGKDVRYGLGVILRATRNGQCLGHSGYFPGYLTEMRWYPAHDLGVAIQVNTSDFQKLARGGTAALLDEIVDVIVGAAKPAAPK